MTDAIKRFLHAALAEEGAPYLWQGKGPVIWTPLKLVPHHLGRNVFDCSGLVGWALMMAGHMDLRASHAANSYYEDFAHTTAPEAGDLLVYVQGGDFVGARHVGGRASHIEIVTEDGRYYGALRGDSDCRTIERAAQMRARVCYRETERLSGAKVFLTNPLRGHS